MYYIFHKLTNFLQIITFLLFWIFRFVYIQQISFTSTYLLHPNRYKRILRFEAQNFFLTSETQVAFFCYLAYSSSTRFTLRNKTTYLKLFWYTWVMNAVVLAAADHSIKGIKVVELLHVSSTASKVRTHTVQLSYVNASLWDIYWLIHKSRRTYRQPILKVKNR